MLVNMKNNLYIRNKKFMYTLYHIKGKKWGCTKRKLSKRLWEQKLSIKDVCDVITVNTKEEADKLEEALNKEYGYGWKSSESYCNMLKVGSLVKKHRGFTEEERLKGAKKGGKAAVDSGQLKSVCSMGGKVGGKIVGKITSQIERTCPTCKRTGRGNRFVHHINNCKIE